MNTTMTKQASTSHEKIGMHARSLGKYRHISDVSTDEELSSISSAECTEEYNFIEELKVIGVHKQECPKAHYSFVIVSTWSDKNRVTVYRRWKDIKKFQHAILKATKGQKHQIEAHRCIETTVHQVKKAARFRRGTSKKLGMINSLNRFFGAVVHYKDTAHDTYVRQFFKPTENDLDSMSWSDKGKTYFYVIRDILGEKCFCLDADESDDEIVEDNYEYSIDTLGLKNTQRTIYQQTKEEFNDALEKYNEADPNISRPINSGIFTALCDFDATTEDRKNNVIGLTKDEEVEVIEKSKSGWWLVTRTKEKSNTESELHEYGYVPASHLEVKSRMVESELDCDSLYGSSTESVGERMELENFAILSSDNASNCSESLRISMESLPTCEVKTPKPKPRTKSLAFIHKTNETSISPLQNRFTPDLCRPRSHSDAFLTSPSTSGPQTMDNCEDRSTRSVPNLSNGYVRSTSICSATSVVSLSKIGTDYVSVRPYRATHADELSFESGSIIKVIRRNSDGWWLATYNEKTGLVPSVDLKRYKDPVRAMLERFS